MTHFAIHPLRRDQSLLVTHRREVEVNLPADVLGEVLAGRREAPAGLEPATAALVSRLRDGIRSAAVTPTAAVDSLLVAVDDAVLDLAPPDTVRALFSVAGLKPDLVPASPQLELDRGDDHALVTLTAHFDVSRMFAWETQVARSSTWWAPLWLTARGLAFGPYVEPADDPADVPHPGPRDLVARWITAASDADHVRARLNHATYERTQRRSHQVLPGLAHFAADVERWLLGERAQGAWHLVEVSGDDISRHPVLPLPQASHPAYEIAGDPQDGLTPDDVLDPVTGIVVALRPIHLSERFPTGITYVESTTADMGRVRPWAANIYNAGSSWDDEDAAKHGAVGEAIERYCGNVYRPEHLRRCSYRRLREEGEHAVAPSDLVLFSDRQYAQRGMPFVPLTEDLEVSWVPGRSMSTGRLTWVPASLVYVNWNTGDSILDPPVNPAYYPGIAAAPSREAALCNALEEVVERDATMVWWLSGASLPVLPSPDFLSARTRPGSGVTTSFVSIPNRFGLPVVGAVAEDTEDGLCTLGLACRRTPDLAARKALLEALGLLESARDMQRPDGGFWSAYAEAGSPDQPIKDIRADRRYLDDYRPDFRDATDLFCQLQVQLDPRAREVTSRRWHEAATSTSWASLPGLDERRSLRYVDALVREGFDPICVELTTSDVRAAGWTAVRVVVPGLVPNFPTAFPPLGGGRVLEEPARLGLVDGTLDEDALYAFPMPYA